MNSNGKKIIIRRACKIGVCKCMNFILRGGGWRRMSITTLHSGHPFFKIPPPLFFLGKKGENVVSRMHTFNLHFKAVYACMRPRLRAGV